MNNSHVWVIVMSVLLVLLAGCGGSVEIASYMNGPALELDAGVIRAVGLGKPPAESASGPQSNFLARRAAIVDATRHLAQKLTELEQVASGRPADSRTILVKNQRILKEEQLSDGRYAVLMEMPLETGLLTRLRQTAK